MFILVSFSDLHRMEKKLTFWMHVQPFLSEILLKIEEQTHFLDECSVILVDLLKHSGSGVNSLSGYVCSTIFVSGSDLLKYQRANSLAGYVINHSPQWF